jgi:hypothetical protein
MWSRYQLTPPGRFCAACGVPLHACPIQPIQAHLDPDLSSSLVSPSSLLAAFMALSRSPLEALGVRAMLKSPEARTVLRSRAHFSAPLPRLLRSLRMRDPLTKHSRSSEPCARGAEEGGEPGPVWI